MIFCGLVLYGLPVDTPSTHQARYNILLWAQNGSQKPKVAGGHGSRDVPRSTPINKLPQPAADGRGRALRSWETQWQVADTLREQPGLRTVQHSADAAPAPQLAALLQVWRYPCTCEGPKTLETLIIFRILPPYCLSLSLILPILIHLMLILAHLGSS